MVEIPPMNSIVCGSFIGTFCELRMPLMESTCGVTLGVRFVPTVSVTVFDGAS